MDNYKYVILGIDAAYCYDWEVNNGTKGNFNVFCVYSSSFLKNIIDIYLFNNYDKSGIFLINSANELLNVWGDAEYKSIIALIELLKNKGAYIHYNDWNDLTGFLEYCE